MPAAGLDQGRGVGLVQPSAQSTDRRIDGVAGQLDPTVIQAVFDLRAGHHLAAAERQVLQQRVFARRQGDDLFVTGDLAGGGVDDDRSQHDVRVLLIVAPPEQGLDARQELFEGKGLGKKIVRARLQTAHAIFDGVTSGEDENVRIAAARAQTLQQRETVEARQHQIQDDDVVAVGDGQLEPLVAVEGGLDGVTGLAQTRAQRALEPLRVFDQEEPQGVPHASR